MIKRFKRIPDWFDRAQRLEVDPSEVHFALFTLVCLCAPIFPAIPAVAIGCLWAGVHYSRRFKEEEERRNRKGP